MEYLKALKSMFSSRDVRGIIISGREDQVAATVLSEMGGYDIKWYCYRVSFDAVPVATSTSHPAAVSGS